MFCNIPCRVAWIPFNEVDDKKWDGLQRDINDLIYDYKSKLNEKLDIDEQLEYRKMIGVLEDTSTQVVNTFLILLVFMTH